MIKRLLVGVLTSLSLLTPAQAEVQEGTRDLLTTVAQYVTVDIDNADCKAKPYMSGSFTPHTKTMVLCPRGDASADDHDTVRHEVWHVIQYCYTPRNTRYLRTVFEPGTDKWDHYIMSTLSPRKVKMIKHSYPRYAWNVEFEAYAIAKTTDSTVLRKLFLQACTR